MHASLNQPIYVRAQLIFIHTPFRIDRRDIGSVDAIHWGFGHSGHEGLVEGQVRRLNGSRSVQTLQPAASNSINTGSLNRFLAASPTEGSCWRAILVRSAG